MRVAIRHPIGLQRQFPVERTGARSSHHRPPPDHTLRLGQPYDVVTNYLGARLKRINLKCRHLSDARKVAQDQLVGKNGHHPTHLANEYPGGRSCPVAGTRPVDAGQPFPWYSLARCVGCGRSSPRVGLEPLSARHSNGGTSDDPLQPCAEIIRDYVIRLSQPQCVIRGVAGDVMSEHLCALLGIVAASQLGVESHPHLRVRFEKTCCSRICAARAGPGTFAESSRQGGRMSVRSLHDLMQHTGQSFSEWILAARVTHARRLLQSPGAAQRKIADIATAAAFPISRTLPNVQGASRLYASRGSPPCRRRNLWLNSKALDMVTAVVLMNVNADWTSRVASELARCQEYRGLLRRRELRSGSDLRAKNNESLADLVSETFVRSQV